MFCLVFLIQLLQVTLNFDALHRGHLDITHNRHLAQQVVDNLPLKRYSFDLPIHSIHCCFGSSLSRLLNHFFNMRLQFLYLLILVLYPSGQLFDLQVPLMLIELVLYHRIVLATQSLVQLVTSRLSCQGRNTYELIKERVDD